MTDSGVEFDESLQDQTELIRNPRPVGLGSISGTEPDAQARSGTS
jgi:hypothetical protein